MSCPARLTTLSLTASGCRLSEKLPDPALERFVRTRYREVRPFDRYGLDINDVGLPASALARPATTMLGGHAYPQLPMKAAAIFGIGGAVPSCGRRQQNAQRGR